MFSSDSKGLGQVLDRKVFYLLA